MNWADWTIIGVLVLSSGLGLIRGLIKEALSLAIWVAAVIIAKTFGLRLATLLVDVIQTPSLRELAAFAILFVLTLIVGAIANYLIGALVKITGLSGTDRLLGLLFGVARGFIILMLVIVFLPTLLPVDQDSWWQQSSLIAYLQRFESWSSDFFASAASAITHLFNRS
ncbi:MAG: CvpA family protein [Marinagarivorans sp.]|nr:CvpA family protein [Marinagarivorans sp.]